MVGGSFRLYFRAHRVPNRRWKPVWLVRGCTESWLEASLVRRAAFFFYLDSCSNNLTQLLLTHQRSVPPGVEAKLGEIKQLKVKGLVLGPLHTVQTDNPNALLLDQIDPTQGKKEDLTAVLEKAHKKGRSLTENQIFRCKEVFFVCFFFFSFFFYSCHFLLLSGMSVVLDMTPNYHGNAPWFSGDVGDVLEKVKVGHTPCSLSHSGVCVKVYSSKITCHWTVVAAVANVLTFSRRLQRLTGWIWVWMVSSCPASALPPALLIGRNCRLPSRATVQKTRRRGDYGYSFLAFLVPRLLNNQVSVCVMYLIQMNKAAFNDRMRLSARTPF